MVISNVLNRRVRAQREESDEEAFSELSGSENRSGSAGELSSGSGSEEDEGSEVGSEGEDEEVCVLVFTFYALPMIRNQCDLTLI